MDAVVLLYSFFLTKNRRNEKLILRCDGAQNETNSYKLTGSGSDNSRQHHHGHKSATWRCRCSTATRCCCWLEGPAQTHLTLGADTADQRAIGTHQRIRLAASRVWRKVTLWLHTTDVRAIGTHLRVGVAGEGRELRGQQHGSECERREGEKRQCGLSREKSILWIRRWCVVLVDMHVHM